MMGLADINAKNEFVTQSHKAEVEARATGIAHFVIKVDGHYLVTQAKPDNEDQIKYTALPQTAEVA